MRILVSTWPAHGHLLPLLPIARAAVRAGHDVVVASGVEGALEARRRGFTAWDVGPSRAEAEAAFRRAVPSLEAVAPPERMATVIAGHFGAAAFGRADQLVPRALGWRPDVVVHPVTELAGAVAAARCGAVGVVHGLGPLPRTAWDWFGARFADLCATWDVPELADDIVDHTYVDDCPPTLQADAVAAFRRRVRVRATSGEVAAGETLPWDDATLAALPHDRTVHLTLGTLFNGATDVFHTALAGLAALGVNVLVTVGPGTDPGRLGRQPPHVLVTDFAPHALLLARCDALVTQGGAGTILAALCHGLPHLILPQGADQFVNAATAEAAGVAIALDPPAATSDAIAAAVARLLDEPSWRSAAQHISGEIASLPSHDDVLADVVRAPSAQPA